MVMFNLSVIFLCPKWLLYVATFLLRVEKMEVIMSWNLKMATSVGTSTWLTIPKSPISKYPKGIQKNVKGKITQAKQHPQTKASGKRRSPVTGERIDSHVTVYIISLDNILWGFNNIITDKYLKMLGGLHVY